MLTSWPPQQRCRHRAVTSLGVAATAATLPPLLRCCHHSCNAAVASSPQQLHHHSCVIATAAHRRTATAYCRRHMPQQPRHCHCIVATAAATLLSRPCCSVAATAALLPLRRHILAHCPHRSHVAAAAMPLPAQQLGCCGRLLLQQPCHRHISPVAATASAALPQPQPPLPMPLPPKPLRCAPMQPWLRCRCRLCHLQPLLHLTVVF